MILNQWYIIFRHSLITPGMTLELVLKLCFLKKQTCSLKIAETVKTINDNMITLKKYIATLYGPFCII
jgi:hypothetical protein